MKKNKIGQAWEWKEATGQRDQERLLRDSIWGETWMKKMSIIDNRATSVLAMEMASANVLRSWLFIERQRSCDHNGVCKKERYKYKIGQAASDQTVNGLPEYGKDLGFYYKFDGEITGELQVEGGIFIYILKLFLGLGKHYRKAEY